MCQSCVEINKRVELTDFGYLAVGLGLSLIATDDADNLLEFRADPDSPSHDKNFAKDRITATESLSQPAFNRLLQQNLPQADIGSLNRWSTPATQRLD
jgi:hypothetical protein